MAETNLETHGSWQKMGATEPSWNVPGNIECWRACTLDRAVSNFETFKNHTSVLFWSLGNESGEGVNFAATYTWVKQRDRSKRPIHSEDGIKGPYTDIYCPMYKKLDVLINHALYMPTKPQLNKQASITYNKAFFISSASFFISI